MKFIISFANHACKYLPNSLKTPLYSVILHLHIIYTLHSTYMHIAKLHVFMFVIRACTWARSACIPKAISCMTCLHMSVYMCLIEGALDGTAIGMLLNTFRYYITIMMLVYEVINHAKQTLHDINQNYRARVSCIWCSGTPYVSLRIITPSISIALKLGIITLTFNSFPKYGR